MTTVRAQALSQLSRANLLESCRQLSFCNCKPLLFSQQKIIQALNMSSTRGSKRKADPVEEEELQELPEDSEE